MGWDKKSLRSEGKWKKKGEKKPQTINAKTLIHSPRPTDRPMPSQSPRNCFPLLLLGVMMCPVGHPVFGVHLSQLCSLPPWLVLITPRLLVGVEAEWEPEKVLMLYKHWSAIAKILVYYQHCFITSTKHSTIWAAVKKMNFIPSRLNIASWQDMHEDWWTHICIMCVSVRLIFLCTLD